MPELSDLTKKLIKQYELAKMQDDLMSNEPKIHVDEVASKVAAFYEHLRTVVEWKEEHLMRRAAITRKLKRKFFELELSNFSNIENTAESLILELIRGGHFPNDKIEESKISDIQKIIDKYVFILKNNPENREGKAGMNFYNWLIEISACEIEETLAPPIREKALIDYMFESMKQKIKIPEKIFQKGILKKEEVDIQIYIAVCLALFKLDKPIVSYYLIKQKFPDWSQALSKEKNKNGSVLKISQSIFKTWQNIEKSLRHPFSGKFYAICEKYDTPYLIMGDILSINSPSEIGKEILEPSALESITKDSYFKRLSTLKSRISRAAIYSTISIFITKVLSLLLLEIIIEETMGGGINPLILGADVLIPTFLMFFMISTVKKPSKKNTNIVIMETMKIAYKRESEDFYEIKTKRKKGSIVIALLSLLYVFSAFVTFGGIYFVLSFLGFPITSIIINILFIALILFTGTAVAKRAQELTVEEEKENFLTFVSDIFFLPMHGLGRWISNKWKKYNAIALLLNALIDMPFSAFVEFLERWRYFIKERKEEIR
jgi:hypothetical protein